MLNHFYSHTHFYSFYIDKLMLHTRCHTVAAFAYVACFLFLASFLCIQIEKPRYWFFHTVMVWHFWFCKISFFQIYLFSNCRKLCCAVFRMFLMYSFPPLRQLLKPLKIFRDFVADRNKSPFWFLLATLVFASKYLHKSYSQSPLLTWPPTTTYPSRWTPQPRFHHPLPSLKLVRSQKA